MADPKGVAEHIDFVDTAEKKTAILAEAKDKLEAKKFIMKNIIDPKNPHTVGKSMEFR